MKLVNFQISTIEASQPQWAPPRPRRVQMLPPTSAPYKAILADDQQWHLFRLPYRNVPLVPLLIVESEAVALRLLDWYVEHDRELERAIRAEQFTDFLIDQIRRLRNEDTEPTIYRIALG